MKRDIALYVAVCDVCIKFLRCAREFHAALHPIHVGFRNEIVALDSMGGKLRLPTTESGNKYILTIVDLFTKFCMVVPMPDHLASNVAHSFYANWILTFGGLYRVHTHQGLEFEGEFSTLSKVWRIAKSRTTEYHPQDNGACERVDQTIKKIFSKLLNKSSLTHGIAFFRLLRLRTTLLCTLPRALRLTF